MTVLRPYISAAGGCGCVGEYHSPGTSPFGTGFSSIGQIGSPVTRSNTYSHACLLGTATTLRGRPSTVTSAISGADDMSSFQIGWCTNWKCHFRLPVAEIDAHQALAEQVVAGPLAAVEVRRRRLDRQVDQAELLVDA